RSGPADAAARHTALGSSQGLVRPTAGGRRAFCRIGVRRARAPARVGDGGHARDGQRSAGKGASREQGPGRRVHLPRGLPCAPPPPPRGPPAPRDPPVWFAMVHGKQQGPITQAELALQASAGQVGPRTYLWKEGMESWIRAKEVPELIPFFAAPPTPPPPPSEDSAAAHPEVGAAKARIGLPFESKPAPVGPEETQEPASPAAPPPPGGTQLPSEAEAARLSEEAPALQPGPTSPGALDLARWGASELSKPRAQTPSALPKASPIPPAARGF